MALPTILVEDFTGFIKINQNSFRTELAQSYIDEFYPQIIEEFLGLAFLTDVETLAILPQKYLDLFNGGDTYENICKEQKLKQPVFLDIVKKVLYFYWVRNDSMNTTSGQSMNDVQNATMLSRNQIASDVSLRYNNAVRLFNTQVIPFLDNYKNYESNITSITDLGGGITQINTTDTIYLADGDTVVIGNEEYEVSNLVADISFEITATFTDVPTFFTYNPFELLEYCEQDPILF